MENNELYHNMLIFLEGPVYSLQPKTREKKGGNCLLYPCSENGVHFWVVQ